MSYNHTEIEKAAQEKWAALDLYTTDLSDDAREKYYLLTEFPYPSGDLHIGHWYAFAVTDIYARMLRLRGRNVLFPIGFDAFGLPAENAAIKHGLDPKEWTYANMERMREQLKSMGASFDWSKEVVTCDPSYYQWTQWLFVKLFEHGLAERREAAVKWCPKDQTVLANEQVQDGKCERCGTEVEEKRLTQWFLKITQYAERLLTGLDPLPWREEIKEAQRAWIGKSEGAILNFPISRKDVARFVLLHGKGGASDKDFFQTLKITLEKAGYNVQVPDLPNADEPNEEEQADFVETHCSIDEHTVVLGHSFGGIVALRLAERGHRLAGITLVATPFTGLFIDGKERPTIRKALEKGFDFEKIKKNTSTIVALYDTHDDIVPISDGQSYADKLGARFVPVQADAHHFNSAREIEIERICVPEPIRVFTTRPDTIFGATYVVLAPEHPLVAKLLKKVSNKKEVRQYVGATAKKSERERSENKEKTGVQLMGVMAINPATKEEIPIYIADYALASYGTGAVMAVPAHDERDGEFAEKLGLSVREVIERGDKPMPYTGTGTLINSGDFTGRESEEAKWDIVTAVGGEKATNYRIRDWLISRQRYWGCPIPIVYDPEGKPHAIPAEHLPWLLPTDVDFTPTGKAPLASSVELKERVTKLFGEGWTPEYDTFDTFMDSSWYFTRYLDAKNTHNFSDSALMKKWLPINRYSGGSEHTTMHLLYARFFMKALYDLALVPVDEPFTERFNRGLIMGPDGAKMSKSKGNVVNPDEFVQKYGADAVRLYLAFIGPYNEPGSYPWNLDGVASMRKFLERVERIVDKAIEKSETAPIEYHVTINGIPVAADTPIEQTTAIAAKKIADDGDKFKFNTGVAQLMVLLNELEANAFTPGINRSMVKPLLIMLAPFAPHLAEHLWEKLGGEGSVHQQPWPNTEVAAATEHQVVVQVNGKRRGSMTLATGASEEEAVAAARALPAVAAALAGKEPSRIVYISDRLLNLVVS